MNSFTRTVDLLHRGMDAETLRREVIANNLANAEVPNFKRSEVNFESELKKALDAQKTRPALEMARSDPRHFSNVAEVDHRAVRPRINLDYLSTVKANGNNVDAEQEVQLLVQNQMKYNLLAQAVAFEFNEAASVMR
ncbi:MAG: flagellar basal body rod protein FlgB [Spirochaetaceae bacterium]|nr:flagellar basal body rod protein FlgB [Spirochaetaceae bacterium]